ncbi:MAG: prolipoprotein diacylglyceryl transferase [Nitrospirota bacterium]
MHPEFFKIGPITIYSYGVMLALAFSVGIYLARERAIKVGINPKIIMDLGVYILLASIVGARLLYVLTNLDEYREHPLTAVFSRYGFVFYGGLIFAIIVGIWYLKRHKLPVWQIVDVLVPSIPIGQVIGRIGCFLNGCCYGKPTTLPWGVMVPGRDPLDLRPLHPTQIYSSVGDLIIFFILSYLWKRRKFEGQILLMYLMLYSILRFIIEMYRGDNPYLLFNLTLSQILSIFIGSGVLTIMVRKNLKR